ncbi:hypothetical protein ACFQU7_19525 [Pseudoroseomonas wenyumeiae]
MAGPGAGGALRRLARRPAGGEEAGPATVRLESLEPGLARLQYGA